MLMIIGCAIVIWPTVAQNDPTIIIQRWLQATVSIRPRWQSLAPRRSEAAIDVTDWARQCF